MTLLESMLRIPGIRIQAACDIWDYHQERASVVLRRNGHRASVYDDYKGLLDNEKGLHAAIVATPDFVHAEHTIACLNAGLHVYCEKAMSNTVEEARRMVLEARRTGKLLQIGHQRRSNPRYIHAIDKLVKGARILGRVTHAYAQWNRALADDRGWPRKNEISPDTLEKYGYDTMDHFRNWQWSPQYGSGPLGNLGSHQIDVLNWAFGGPPSRIIASGGFDSPVRRGSFDNVMCILDYPTPEGVSRAYYQVLTTTGSGGHYERFMGEDGAVVISEIPACGNGAFQEAAAPDWDPFRQKGLLEPPKKVVAKKPGLAADPRGTPPEIPWPIPVVFTDPPHQPHIENFFNAIRTGVPLNCPAETAFQTAVVIHKINEAINEAKRLDVTPEEYVA